MHFQLLLKKDVILKLTHWWAIDHLYHLCTARLESEDFKSFNPNSTDRRAYLGSKMIDIMTSKRISKCFSLNLQDSSCNVKISAQNIYCKIIWTEGHSDSYRLLLVWWWGLHTGNFTSSSAALYALSYFSPTWNAVLACYTWRWKLFSYCKNAQASSVGTASCFNIWSRTGSHSTDVSLGLFTTVYTHTNSLSDSWHTVPVSPCPSHMRDYHLTGVCMWLVS